METTFSAFTNCLQVAEVLKVPLYVLDLAQVADQVEDAQLGRPPPMDMDGRRRVTIEHAFSMAARWKALLLVDECDLYLEPRSESTPVRNRIVTSMSPFYSLITFTSIHCPVPTQ